MDLAFWVSALEKKKDLMKTCKSLVYVIVMFLMVLSIESCTHKTLKTGEDGFKYYQVTRNKRIGIKDLDGNVIVPIKMRDIIYRSRENNKHSEDRWFWCECYDNNYKEIYDANYFRCIIGENLRFKSISDLFQDQLNTGYKPTSTFFYVRREGSGCDVGAYDFNGNEVIPSKYESVGNLMYKTESERDRKFMAKYADPSDLLYCYDSKRIYAVFDANGKCIIPDKFGYKRIVKTDVPTAIPLLCCTKSDGGYDYRYSTSGELFLSGDITTKVIDKKKELYYLVLKDENNDFYYYDVFGKFIVKGDNLQYDDEKGFYYSDYNYNYDLVNHYINKKIDENGHVVSAHSYSNTCSNDELGLLYEGEYTEGRWVGQTTGWVLDSPMPNQQFMIYEDYMITELGRADYVGNTSNGKRKYVLSGISNQTYFVDNYFNITAVASVASFGSVETYSISYTKGRSSYNSDNGSYGGDYNDYNGTSGGNNSGTSGNPVQPHYVTKDCPLCHGSGNCNTCNGKHWYYGFTGDIIICPNCKPDGRCTHCGGSGKITKTEYY